MNMIYNYSIGSFYGKVYLKQQIVVSCIYGHITQGTHNGRIYSF